MDGNDHRISADAHLDRTRRLVCAVDVEESVMNLTRRTFLKVNAVGAAALAGAATSAEASTRVASLDGPAMLVDTTKCIGCRGCEAACAEANRNGALEQPGDEAVFDRHRTTDPYHYTVVNRYVAALSAPGEQRFIKTQCMHCLEPACASACPARALEKTKEGPIVYHGERCLGCRYCMIACPFDIPKFEYAKAIPFIKKCSFCAERQANGQMPACAEVCPSGALQFGRRSVLLEEARKRIYDHPNDYVHHIYGEEEAGGTSWLYLSDTPFERLGLKAGLSTTPYPALTDTALSAVPVVMTLWPPLLMGLYTFSRQRNGESEPLQEERHE
jgi:Fe-S-cluster-containing dehydrogenase component